MIYIIIKLDTSWMMITSPFFITVGYFLRGWYSIIAPERDQNYLKSFELWCWRRMVEIICSSHVRKEKVLRRVKEERNILRTIRRRKANWFCCILRRNCLLKHVIEGKIVGRGRSGRRRKQLLDDLDEIIGHLKLKARALARTHWRKGYVPVLRHTASWMMVQLSDHEYVKYRTWTVIYIYIYIYIRGVTGGTDQTSGGCSLCYTIPI